LKINKVKEFQSNFKEIDINLNGNITGLLNNKNINLKTYGKYPDIKIGASKPGITPLRNKIISLFAEEDWEINKRVFDDRNESIHLFKNKTLLQLSFGHYAQGYFDILKMRHGYERGLSSSQIIVSLNNDSVRSNKISGNLVNFDNLIKQYEYFDKFLHFPIVFLELI
tara:strand:- start:1100 stop:1603 length:504 start_codon:yes stop_codon:yes gene_type:complete